MGSFKFDGIDFLEAHTEQLAQLTEDDIYSVLEPAAELLKTKQQDKIKETFAQHTGALADSLKIQRRSGEDGATAYIALTGKHPGSGTGRRHKKGRSSGKYSGTNAEVGYILEYGSPRIPATHWLETVNEESGNEVEGAMAQAWDELVSEKGL